MSLRQSLALNLPLLVLLAACGSPSVDPETPEAENGASPVEAISLLGEELERAELPDKPRIDHFPIDELNRAYNPPCVFTAHATCPLPPRQNRMALRVEAGERMVEGYLDH